MSHRKLLAFLLVAHLACLAALAGEATVVAGTINPAEKLTYSVSLLADPSGQLSLPEVVGSGVFQPAGAAQFDRTTRAYWLRISAQGTTKHREFWTIKVPFFDTSEIYLPDSGKFRRLISGADIPFFARPVQYGEFPCFAVPVTDTASVFYLRLASNSKFSYDLRRLSDSRFIAPADFASTTYDLRYFHGVFLGITLALIIFNMIIYIMYREKSYLVYSAFMVTQTLYHLSATGFLMEFVFSNLPRIGKHSPFDIAAISLMGYMYFSQVYLETKRFTPKLHAMYNWLYAVISGIAALGYFYDLRLANNLLLLSGLPVVTFPFFMGIIAYRKNYRPALYFLIASVLSYIAYFVYVSMMMKLVPPMLITRYALQITFALQSLLFAMGLADKMNLIRKELEQKKLEKERLEREQEQAIKKLLEEQNRELEIKVRERTAELEVKNKEVESDREIIRQEREKSDGLLLNILPGRIAERLKSGEEMIAERFDNVTVFFSDIVGFTKLSKRVSPERLVGQLNDVFSAFDLLALQYGLEKIKTIGDAYMCVCGLPDPRADHAERVALFALGVQKAVQQFAGESDGQAMSVRIGIHSGTVVAGVIGRQKFAYDLWGETVNTASRLESHGEPFKIQCSPATFGLLKDKFHFEERGEIELKGMGNMKTYFLISKKTLSSSDRQN